MPFGTLPVKANAIPQFAPPYAPMPYNYSDVTFLKISYRVTSASISHLVPDVLELEDEPLVSAMLVDYGMSTLGPYKEYIHTVDVTYKGKVSSFFLFVLLDNESGIFGGREQYGYPKRFGHPFFNMETGSNMLEGYVEKPLGQKIIKFNFTPSSILPTEDQAVKVLNLRVIPSPLEGQPPSVKELVPAVMEIKPSEIWVGSGSISFPEPSAFDFIHRLEILRYEPAVLIRRATTVLQPSTEVFPL
ncbi:hypothetical protein PENCOP_c005G02668 [Penicillium coprophilum]|uniref:Acetoacetate decarboxylase n=1 Tax=Penicillium coprophilum TaxID=36646 RepID=A0A1V6URS6_9EURO|nr:hypothetical protein PENCOP_c005G02668 [Penicillium coprophilum]